MNKERRLFYIVLLTIAALLVVAGALSSVFFISLSDQEPSGYRERIASLFGRGKGPGPVAGPEEASLELAIGTSGRARKYDQSGPTHPPPRGVPPAVHPADDEPEGRVSDVRADLPLFVDDHCEEYGGELDLGAAGAELGIFLGPGQVCMNLRRPEVYLSTNETLKYMVDGQEKDACLLDRELYVCLKMQGPRPVVADGWERGLPAAGTNAPKPAWQTDTGVLDPVGPQRHFRGLNPEQWFSDISAYAHVQYKDIYPGVDMIGYADRKRLEYVFVVGPGADPDSIRFALDGTAAQRLDAAGNLVLPLECGKIVMRAPAFYHIRDGLPYPLRGRYRLDKRLVRLVLPRRGEKRPEFRRPALDMLSYLGGAGDDRAYAVTTDARGHVYIVGEAASPTFLAEERPQRRTRSSTDAFVTKIRVADAKPVYTAFIGGSGMDRAFGVAADAQGNVYVCGETLSSDFPEVNSIPSARGGESWDAFLVKLDADGNLKQFGSRIGGKGDDRAYAVALGQDGTVYLAGETSSPDFPRTRPLGSTRKRPAGLDAFVARLDLDAGALDYTAVLGGAGDDGAYGVAVGVNGALHIAGETRSDDLPVARPLQARFGGGRADAFVAGIRSDDATLLYATFLGGNNDDRVLDIGTDAAGNVYLAGETSSPDLPVANAVQPRFAGGDWDGLVAKFAPGGTGAVYVTYLGGSGDDRAFAVSPDTSGHAHVAGGTSSTNLSVLNAVQPEHAGGVWDGFATRIDPGGRTASYLTYLGGSGTDIVHSACLGYDRTLQVVGMTTSTDLPCVNPMQRIYAGGKNDALAARLLPPEQPGPPLAAVPPTQPGGPAYDFLMATYEVTNDEYARFLNNAQANPNNARGTNLFFDAAGNVWFNPLMEDERHEVFSVHDSRIVYRADYPPGSRYSVTPRVPPQGGSYSNHAAVGMSWYGAVKYCNWLTIDSGRGINERCYREGTNDLDWAPVTCTDTNWMNGLFTHSERSDWLAFRGYRLPMDNCAVITNWVVETDILVRTQQGTVRRQITITNRVAGDVSFPNPFNEFYRASAWTGSTNMPYGFGRNILSPRCANYLDAGLVSQHDTTPVGFYDGTDHFGKYATLSNDNACGIFDLSGNVNEWLTDPGLPGSARDRACYGGSWMFGLPKNHERFYVHPHFTDRFRGFRVVTTFTRDMYIIRVPYRVCLCGYGTGPGCAGKREEEAEAEEEEEREEKEPEDNLRPDPFDDPPGVVPKPEPEPEVPPIRPPPVSPSDV